MSNKENEYADNQFETQAGEWNEYEQLDLTPPIPEICPGFEPQDPTQRFSVSHFCDREKGHKGPCICEICNTQFEGRLKDV